MDREDFTCPGFTQLCSCDPSLLGLPATATTTTTIANKGAVGDFVACVVEMMGVVLTTVPPELCTYNNSTPVQNISIADCLKKLAKCCDVVNYFFLLQYGISDCTKYSDEEIRSLLQCIFNLLMSLAVKLDAIIKHGTGGKEEEYATRYLTKMLKQDHQPRGQDSDGDSGDGDGDGDDGDDGSDDDGDTGLLLQRRPALPFPFYPERCLQYLQEIVASTN